MAYDNIVISENSWHGQMKTQHVDIVLLLFIMLLNKNAKEVMDFYTNWQIEISDESYCNSAIVSQWKIDSKRME